MNNRISTMHEQDSFPGTIRLNCRFAGEDSDVEYDLSQAHPAAPLNPEILMTKDETGYLGMIVRVNPGRDIPVVHLSIHIRFSSCFNRIFQGSRSISRNAGSTPVDQRIEIDGVPIVFVPESPDRNLVVIPNPDQPHVRACVTLTHEGVAGLEWVCFEDPVVPVSMRPGEHILFRCRIESLEAVEGDAVRLADDVDRLADAEGNPRDRGGRFHPDRLLKGLIFASLFPWIGIVAMIRWTGSFRHHAARERGMRR